MTISRTPRPRPGYPAKQGMSLVMLMGVGILALIGTLWIYAIVFLTQEPGFDLGDFARKLLPATVVAIAVANAYRNSQSKDLRLLTSGERTTGKVTSRVGSDIITLHYVFQVADKEFKGAANLPKGMTSSAQPDSEVTVYYDPARPIISTVYEVCPYLLDEEEAK